MVITNIYWTKRFNAGLSLKRFISGLHVITVKGLITWTKKGKQETRENTKISIGK